MGQRHVLACCYCGSDRLGSLILTHEQAAFLRAVGAFAITRWTWIGSTSQEVELQKMVPFCKKSGDAVSVNEIGHRALAEYDAKYMVVERAEHRRLTSLENKIDDFLDWSMLGNNQLEVGEEGGLRVHWAKGGDEDPDNGYWVVDDTTLPPTEDAWPYYVGGRGYCGDAMREAFRIWCAKWDAAHEGEDDEQA